MKRSTLLRLMAAGAAGIGTSARGEPAAEVPLELLTTADLRPELDGKEVNLAFEVVETYFISGSVPLGQVPSFGIKPVQKNPAYRFSVLVSGDLADVMYRFGMTDPGSRSAKGRVMQATGKLTLFPPRAGVPNDLPSYQLNIRDWKKFKLLPSNRG